MPRPMGSTAGEGMPIHGVSIRYQPFKIVRSTEDCESLQGGERFFFARTHLRPSFRLKPIQRAQILSACTAYKISSHCIPRRPQFQTPMLNDSHTSNAELTKSFQFTLSLSAIHFHSVFSKDLAEKSCFSSPSASHGLIPHLPVD